VRSLPPLALWLARLDGHQSPRQITPPEAWYEQPDVHGSGLLSAAWMKMQFDIWQFPFGRDAAENVRRGEQLTQQTGQVMTPTGSPAESEVAFLSDSGGLGNLWVISPQSGLLRQITFEEDPGVTVGLPVWSPDGRSIAYVSSKGHRGFEFGVWLVNSDGTNPRNLVPRGLGMAW